MLKLFLDTNILVSATFWERSAYRLLIKIMEKKADGFTSNEILQEYRTVLKRDFQQEEYEVDARIEALLEVLTVVSPTKRLDVIKDDPTDNRVLEGALESSVNFIVSYDQHLSDLKEFKGIRIVKPEQILEII